MFFETINLSQILIWSFFWFVFSLVWAIGEIEIEGKYGWTEKSETWYRSAQKNPKNIFIKYVMGGKPLTGYHFPIFIIAFMISHIPMLNNFQWSISGEIAAIVLFLTWAPLWDNLWIIFNPHYGLKNSGPKKLWWYQNSKWLFNIIPSDNLIQWLTAIIITTCTSFYFNNLNIIYTQIIFMTFLIIFSVLSYLLFNQIYTKYYWSMRKHDDRKDSGIFHK